MEPREAILRLVDELPFSAGRSGLARILRGSRSSAIGPDRCRLHGVLGGTSEAAIIGAIDALLEEGLLETHDRDGLRLVRLTERGSAAIELL
jgi:hypothetical protein